MFFVRPQRLGVVNGRLHECPASPNCVCSITAGGEHGIAPLTFSDDWPTAKARLLKVVKSLPRARVVTDSDVYLHIECTSLLFRFVDDLEFLAEPTTGIIHVRSASRVGHSDLGVNRHRVESIRSRFAKS